MEPVAWWEKRRMTVYWDNGVSRLYHADARRIPLPDESVHCVVTSPPYFGLRDYGLEPSVWGGDPDHAHEWLHDRWYVNGGGSTRAAGGTFTAAGKDNAQRIRKGRWREAAFCDCGAWLGALGLEPTLELYVEHIVEVFREVWRVLRPDGTLWLNLGDSYAGSGKGLNADGTHSPGKKQATNTGSQTAPSGGWGSSGLKSKDLMLVPFEVASALRRDGWWLRSPVIIEKLNPMPESADDRLTTAHEYLFLLAKSGRRLYWTHRDGAGTRTKPPPDYRYRNRVTGEEVSEPPAGWHMPRDEDDEDEPEWRRINLWRGRDYFFDGHAIREPLAESSVARISQPSFWQQTGGPKDHRNGVNPSRSARHALENLARRTPSGWNVNHDEPDLKGRYPQRKGKTGGHHREHQGFNDDWDHMPKAEQQARGANARPVWRMAARGYRENHYATFSEELPLKCILAGTSEHGVCARCGAPWERMVERRFEPQEDVSAEKGIKGSGNQKPIDASNGWDGFPRGTTQSETLGWQPTCDHDAAVVPATVLDPCVGSGTTSAVAQRLGRRSVGLDASADYLKLAAKRIGAVTLPLPLGSGR